MSTVSKLERIAVEVQEALYEGGHRAATANKHAWKCDGCGLVWPMRWHAQDCEARGHVTTFSQEYHSGSLDAYGKPYPPRIFTREALRREPAISHVTQAEPARSYSVRVKGYLFHICANPAEEARRALAAQTAHDDWLINQTGRIFQARIRNQTGRNYTAEGLPHSIYVTPAQAIALDLPLQPPTNGVHRP